MSFKKITEQASFYDDLEHKSVHEILEDINREDQKVALAVHKTIPQIEQLVERIVPRMRCGGRIFYLGAGTSGRLGVLDASELPPTFGVPKTLVIGLIAGGDAALRNAWSVPRMIRSADGLNLSSITSIPTIPSSALQLRNHALCGGSITQCPRT